MTRALSLEELHARYDGPIPQHLRDAAMDGPAKGSREASESAWGRVRYWHRRRSTGSLREQGWARVWFLCAVQSWAFARGMESASVNNTVGALGWFTFSANTKASVDRAKARAGMPEAPVGTEAA